MGVPAGKATLAALSVAGIAGVIWWRTRQDEDRLSSSQRSYIRELARQLIQARISSKSPKIRRVAKLLEKCARDGVSAAGIAERIAALLGTTELDDESLLGIEMFLLKLEEEDERLLDPPAPRP